MPLSLTDWESIHLMQENVRNGEIAPTPDQTWPNHPLTEPWTPTHLCSTDTNSMMKMLREVIVDITTTSSEIS